MLCTVERFGNNGPYNRKSCLEYIKSITEDANTKLTIITTIYRANKSVNNLLLVTLLSLVQRPRYLIESGRKREYLDEGSGCF
jgi:hypothetical protein